jgi:hypothetical protein
VLSTESDLLRYLKSPNRTAPTPPGDPLQRLPSLLDLKP